MELLASFKSQPKAGAGHHDDERLEAIARKIAAMPEKEIVGMTVVEGKKQGKPCREALTQQWWEGE